MVNKEIKNIREALVALTVPGTGKLLSDLFNVISELLLEQTGLKVKDSSGQVADVVEIVKNMENIYRQQLADLLKEESNETVYQKTLEQEILDIKEQ